jgi:hypothetical protein
MTTSEHRQLSPHDMRDSIQVTLTRIRSSKTCTIGILYIQTRNLRWSCRTLELPWLDNQPQISCIPKGTYTCRRLNSVKFGETFQVCDVPGRQGILFHAGNTAKDTRGCILLGTEATRNNDSCYLEASRAAMRTFRQMLDGIDTFTLEIK